MAAYAYDLHIHTCLSPCASDDMTPPNIVNMARLKGLDVIAVTDHNSARNTRAVARAAETLAPALRVIPGIEVNTAEDIHIICLFPGCDAAEAAGEALEATLPNVDNRRDIWGAQLVMDENEQVLREFPLLLLGASTLTVDDLPAFAARYGGVCFPAHVDRPHNGILGVLGALPDTPVFPFLEVNDPLRFFADPKNACYRHSHRILTSSDAHSLVDIAEPLHTLTAEEFPLLASFFPGG